MKIEVFLSELLYEHDCVIIPQFGGLVANYRHARLNELNHTVYPPSKQVAFNRNLVQNDGLLYKHAGDILGLGYLEAKTLVDDAIKLLKNKLQGGERVLLDRIGIFFPDKRGVIQFIPSDQQNYLLQSFGLPSIQLQPIAKPQIAVPQMEEPTEVKVVAMTPKRNSSVRWKIAAAIAVPLLLAGGWIAGESIFSDQSGMTSLKLINWSNVVSEYEPRRDSTELGGDNRSSISFLDSTMNAFEGEVLKYSFLNDSPDSTGIAIRVKPTETSDSSEPEVFEVEPSVGGQKRFHLIAGAFQIESNAANLIQQLGAKGLKAYTAGKSGELHLVAVGSYFSKEEADAAKSTVRSDSQLKCWVLKKK